MTKPPNLYGFATKELAQDATLAYILAWADPTYRESYPCLHALGTELLRSLLATQKVCLPRVETVRVETQVERIDIVARINADKNANRIILIIEDKVSTQEHSNQIERYKETAEKRYSGRYDCLVAVYLKTGNESEANLPPEDKCGRFLRHDLLKVLNGYMDTGNVIVDDFRRHLQNREDATNRWKCMSYRDWQWNQWEGFYAAIEARWNDWCDWGYVSNPAGGFLGCWLGGGKIGTVDLYMQIHDARRLTVRLGSGNTMDKVRSPFMYQVLSALEQVSRESSDDIRFKKAGRFRGGCRVPRLQTSRSVSRTRGLPLTPTAS